MAEQLKHFFSANVVSHIAEMISAVHPSFPHQPFSADANHQLDQLELLPRARHISHALRKHLPLDFAEAARILQASLGPRRAATEGDGMSSFLYLPHVFYVAEFGIEHFETSLELQYELTRRFTAEYSIRVFLDRYPDRTLARLREWTADPDVHVRRLVSEGTRPRLPWAPRLRRFQEDPGPVLELLELLKDDPELYVRRSVANNLNDIGKDHPDILVATARRWLADAPPEREWLVKHALRSAVKRGEAGALKVLGYGRAPSVEIKRVTFTPKRAQIGESVRIEFDVVSTAARRQSLLVDVRVFFVKADGKASPKVFKLKQIELAPGASARLAQRISLRQMTTRKHYRGDHAVEVVVNGVGMGVGRFRVY